jgi:hypothetical protein
MGIDFIDVHYRLERRFSIRMDSDERFYLLRAGWIHFLVTEKLRGVNPPIPDTRAILERISDALSAAPDERGWFGRLFHEDLAFRIPAAERRDHWQRIEERLGLPLPPLQNVPGEAAPRFPPDCATIRQFLGWVAFTYRDRLPQKDPGGASPPPAGAKTWTDTSLWAAIQDELVDALNVDRTMITPEAWLIEDLGAA